MPFFDSLNRILRGSFHRHNVVQLTKHLLFSSFKHVLKIPYGLKTHFGQECIPVLCVPLPSVVISPACTPPSCHACIPPCHACPLPQMPPPCHACPLPAMHAPSLTCMPPPYHSCPHAYPFCHAHPLPCMPPTIYALLPHTLRTYRYLWKYYLALNFVCGR